MLLRIKAACGCHCGHLRKKNEDNFYFSGTYLAPDHGSMDRPVCAGSWCAGEWTAAVFDGMGGEHHGQIASFAAARALASVNLSALRRQFGLPECLTQLARELNRAVVAEQQELQTSRMGSTMVGASFFRGTAYIWNLGDSRAYLLRAGQLRQLSVDHIAHTPPRPGRKPPLTQYLGIDPSEMMLEPAVCAERCARGDLFLLCSDGLSDLLTRQEIAQILQGCPDPEEHAARLIEAALDRGGRDNITVIVCMIV